MNFDMINAIFTDKEAARLYLEGTRWPKVLYALIAAHLKSKN